MPIIIPQSGEREGPEQRKGPVWDFWRNTIQDVRELGPAMILGPLMLGRDIAVDAANLGDDSHSSRTLKTLEGVKEGFLDESPLVPFVKGDFGEAGSRWHQRPVSGTLDFAGGAGAIAGGSSKLARGFASMAPTSKLRKSFMDSAGYDFIGKANKVEDPTTISDSLKYKYGPGVTLGDDVFARPTHRRILPSVKDDLLLKDPMSFGSDRKTDYFDLDNVDILPTELQQRLKSIESWKPLSRNPLWRGAGEGLGEFRRQIPAEMPFSSSKQMMRKSRRGVEKDMFTSTSRARALHEPANKRLMNDIANDLRVQGIQNANINKLTDYVAYLAAAGYASIAHRLDDLERTHGKGATVQLERMNNAKIEYQVLAKERDQLGAQIDKMKADGIDMSDKRVDELIRDKHNVTAKMAKVNAIVEGADDFNKKREGKPDAMNDPRSGYAYELDQIRKLDRNLIDKYLNSDYIEKWLDDIELATEQSEALAVTNYGRGLTAEEATKNRYRMAQLYHANGNDPRVRALYQRQRKDGRGERIPLFIPMQSTKKAHMSKKGGARYSPLHEVPETRKNDPLNLELWGSNARNPITGGLFLKKHAEELMDRAKSKVQAQAFNLGVPMTKNQVEMWKQQGIHSGEKTVTSVTQAGRPLDPDAPFIDIGDFADEFTQKAAWLNEIEDGLRRAGREKDANTVAKARAVAIGQHSEDVRGRMRTGKELSTKQLERQRRLDKDQTVVLPTPVYSSLVDELIQEAGVIMEVAAAPSLRKTAKKGMKKGMQYWKYSVLHTRPKWIFNNALGSIYMLAMQEGWLPALYNIFRNSTAFNWARRMLGIKPKKLEHGGMRYINESIESKMSDVLYAHGSTSMFGFSEKGLGSIGRVEKAMDWIADQNAKFADNPARSARIFTLLDEMVDAKVAHQRALGNKVDLTPELRDQYRLQILNNPVSREKIATIALEDMIDFQDLTRAERTMVAYAVPFWSWIKGSSKATGRHIADHPLRFGWQKELGLEASRQVEEQFPGGVPSYLLSSLPGGLFGDDRRSIMNFAGASPAQSIADMTAMGVSLAGGAPLQFGTESPVGMLGPQISGPMAMWTYRNPFFGTPYSKDMLPPEVLFSQIQPPFWRSLYRGQAGSLPYVPDVPEYPWQLIPGTGGKPYEPSGSSIAEHDPRSYGQRLISPYTQKIVPSVAAERYREEQTDLGY